MGKRMMCVTPPPLKAPAMRPEQAWNGGISTPSFPDSRMPLRLGEARLG
jgi:hypothetical protein